MVCNLHIGPLWPTSALFVQRVGRGGQIRWDKFNTPT